MTVLHPVCKNGPKRTPQQAKNQPKMSLSLNFRKAVLTTITAGNPSYLLETTANSSSGIRISQRYEKKDRCCRCPKIRETSSVFLWFLLLVSAKMGHLRHQGVSVTTNERTRANGGGHSEAEGRQSPSPREGFGEG